MENITFASIYKRILSFVIDSIIVILMAVILFFPVNKVVENSFLYEQKYSLYQEEFKLSNLFLFKNEQRIKLNEDETNRIHYCDYADVVYKYYIDYKKVEKDSEYSYYWFNVNILGLEDILNRYDVSNTSSSIFEYGSDVKQIANVKTSLTNVTTFDESLSKVALNSVDRYMLEQYSKAVSDFESNKIYSTEAYRQVVLVSFIAPIICVIIGMITFSIIVPSIDKEHRTIGKFITKTAVINKEGYRLSLSKIIVRQLFTMIVEIILGIVTIGGMTLISYTCLMISKDKQSLHDKIIGSIVVDSVKSQWYETKEQMDEELSKEVMINGTKEEI